MQSCFSGLKLLSWSNYCNNSIFPWFVQLPWVCGFAEKTAIKTKSSQLLVAIVLALLQHLWNLVMAQDSGVLRLCWGGWRQVMSTHRMSQDGSTATFSTLAVWLGISHLVLCENLVSCCPLNTGLGANPQWQNTIHLFRYETTFLRAGSVVAKGK